MCVDDLANMIHPALVTPMPPKNATIQRAQLGWERPHWEASVRQSSTFACKDGVAEFRDLWRGSVTKLKFPPQNRGRGGDKRLRLQGKRLGMNLQNVPM